MADPEPHINPWLIAVSVMLATFMEVLDTSIAAVALPHIAGSLSASTDEATWVLTSYLVANAIVLPASTWFALRFGRKRFLLFCIVVFTASSFLCGAATGLGMILFARALQGAGGGALQPLSQAILLESFPPQKRGSAMAVFALGVVVAPVLGPTLGGWLTDNYSWRWAFYINIPVGIAATMMISRFIRDPDYIRDAKPGRLDGIGLGLLTLWLGALQIILDKGQEEDWLASNLIRSLAVVLAVTFVWFLYRQLTIDNPIVDLRVFKNRNFALGCLMIGLFGGVIYGIVTILPLFYQTLLGYPASAAGLAVSPRGIGAILIMPVIGYLTSRIDNRFLIAIGFALFGITSLWMAGLTLDISPTSLLWPIIISGCASGMVFVPLSTSAMGTLKNEQIGNASGLYNLLRNIGGGIGISVVNTLISRHQQVHRSELIGHLGADRLTVQERLQALQGKLGTADRAWGMLNNLANQQATLWAYIDDLRYLALVCFVCVPLVFALKRVRARQGAAAAAH